MRQRKSTDAGLSWPTTIEHRGVCYDRTGKLGTHCATLRPTAEYQHGGARLWAFVDGVVATENA